MKRKFYLGTNWKMHMTNREARQYISEIAALLKGDDASAFSLFVIPSFTALQLVHDAIDASGLDLKLGAQNAHWETADESTGEISVRILKDIGIDLVELGHSERRRKFGETNEIVNRKVRAALAENFQVLLCIGEEREEKQRDQGRSILKSQLLDGLKGVSNSQAEKVIVAYEPVWAIGPDGEPATADYVAGQHAFIREALIQRFGEETGREISVIYGGSVNHQNCQEYATLENVDGLFVGRTAWDAGSFVKMIRSLERSLVR